MAKPSAEIVGNKSRLFAGVHPNVLTSTPRNRSGYYNSTF
jgi:hypothetical protein